VGRGRDWWIRRGGERDLPGRPAREEVLMPSALRTLTNPVNKEKSILREVIGLPHLLVSIIFNAAALPCPSRARLNEEIEGGGKALFTFPISHPFRSGPSIITAGALSEKCKGDYEWQ
jgi:hypothetical protein